MQNNKMEKKIKIVGDLEVGGERGCIVFGGGYCNLNYCHGIQRPNESFKKVIRIGNASSDKSQAGTTYSRKGMAPTICACTHGYAIGYIIRKYEKHNDSGNNREHGKTKQR